MIRNILKLSLRKTLPLNVSAKRTQRTHLSPKTLERMIELNQLDLSLYQEALKILKDRHRTRVALDPYDREKKTLATLPTLTEIQFNFEDRFIGENWHIRENTPPNVFCWSSHTTSTLTFSIKKENHLFISFHAIYFLIPNSHQRLTLTANFYRVALSRYKHPKGGWIFEGVIPHHALQKDNTLLTLSFSLPELKRSIDINPDNSDMRPLGFACQSVKIKPIYSTLWITRLVILAKSFKIRIKQKILARQSLNNPFFLSKFLFFFR